jgi:SAM-dependent methyltransferase
MAKQLLRRPFDHYARYRLTADVVEAVGAQRILDVGGGPGSLGAFCPDREIIATDLHLPGESHDTTPSFVLADGAGLPFGDDTFDCVVSLDTLEHVPGDKRDGFLSEAVRVSSGWVLIVCPCDTPGVSDADEALLALVRCRFGEGFPTVQVLTEHLGFGHPDPEAVTDALTRAGAEVSRFPSGRLDRWLPMMLAFYDLLALGDDEPVDRVQAWYNARFYHDDLREPAYRQAFLGRVAGAHGPAPGDVAARLLPVEPSPMPTAEAFHALQVILQDALVPLLRDARDELTQARRDRDAARGDTAASVARAEAAEARAVAAEARVAAAEDRAEALEAFRAEVHTHPVLRARRWVRRRTGRD